MLLVALHNRALVVAAGFAAAHLRGQVWLQARQRALTLLQDLVPHPVPHGQQVLGPMEQLQVRQDSKA